MILEVDTAGALPAYEQIRAQVAEMAATGALPHGFRLPSIRQLAGDLGLAPGTVARAYKELEAAGVVQTRVGRGTVVADDAPRMTAAERHRRLVAAARSFVSTAHALGVDDEQALAAIRTATRGRPLPT